MAEKRRPATLLCADIGSTFIKTLLVDLETAELVASAQRPTVGDVLRVVEECRAELAVTDPRAADAPTLACSSAGGGLRIAVVGNEELVTAEAGRRVALSSGGKVVHVSAGRLDPVAATAVMDDEPDVVLLTGGTNGGDSSVLLHNAALIASEYWTVPVVVAGNRVASERVSEALRDGGTPHVVTDNVVPRIGVLAPDGARAAIREMFLKHVIAGKGLTPGPGLAAVLCGPTPDVVLSGVEVLARVTEGAGVAVVDVGGSTTDVYSVRAVDPELSDEGLGHDVVAATPANRTVEGDLGMRESAGLDRAFVPTTDEEHDADEAVARAAAEEAVRRHAGRSRVTASPEGRVVERTGVDLREVALVVGSGGVLRHGRPGVAERVLGGLVAADHPDGWQLPERARVLVDEEYLLLAVGLLAASYPDVAERLARRLTESRPVL